MKRKLLTRAPPNISDMVLKRLFTFPIPSSHSRRSYRCRACLGGLQKQFKLLLPSQTGCFGPASLVKLAMKPFSASTGMVKPQNRGFTSFMDGFYLGGSKVGTHKLFYQMFFKTAPTPPEKPLHQRSQSRSRF